MNICRVTRAFFPVIDGAALHAWNLSRQQAASGHKVWIIQPHLSSKDDLPAGLTLVKVRLSWFYRSIYRSKLVMLLFNLLAARKAWKLSRQTKVDVIHAHGDVFEGFCQGLLGCLLKVPVILTVHGGLNEKRIYRYAARRMFRFASRFVAVSEEVKEDLERVGVSSYLIDVISSGIEYEKFAAAASKESNREIKIVFVGRIHEVKGLEYLIEAARLLEVELPRAKFTIIGDGPSKESLTAKSKEVRSIRFVGERQPEELPRFLAEASLFVLPSVDLPGQTEGTPTAVMEAMAAGLPIVCTDAGGTSRLVQNSINGLVVRQKDPEALKKAILDLAQNKSLREEMSHHNQELAKHRDWSSGAAFLVRREMFKAVKGFEESLFLYAEDVDLSFKIRNSGSKCRYVPKAVVWHYSYAKPHEIKPVQQFYSLRNNLLLRCRYGRFGQIIKGYWLVKLLFLRGERGVPGIRRLAFKALFSHLPLVPRMIAWRSKNLKKRYFKGYKFFGFDYELHKSGAFHECDLPSTNELVSVIVRTTNRPEMLREALRTVANQTYPNIEVIVVEDGPAASEQVIAEFRELLDVKYYSTTEELGRCKAGNKGLELAKGTYINFLDDDDLFYADHVETLVAALQKDKDFKAAHSACYEAKVKTVGSDRPEIVALHPFYEAFDRGKLRARNLFPIQVVAFHRSLYDNIWWF